MKVLLFTDTYADVNGPSRFIQNIAEQARLTDRGLHVFTSTRIPHASKPNVTNFDPLVAIKMPKYDTLDLTLPPGMRMLRAAKEMRPDVIHISTPGPVGCVGLMAARALRCPLLGVYHTDFPAYIQRLFEDDALFYVCQRAMRMFYGRFGGIFTRSADYARSLEGMGIPKQRLTRLLPGIDLEAFKPEFRDERIWESLPMPGCPLRGCGGGSGNGGGGGGPVRVLYCGRVSVEKNLPLLARVWKVAGARLRQLGVASELVVVGDGPYGPLMREELASECVRFVGFRHGRELSEIYASSDLFVFPSVTDTLGQVVMESQASGLAVLVTDQGGPKEVVEDGVTGRVLAADRPDVWVDAIVSLVCDDRQRRAMGEAAGSAMRKRSIAASFEHFWTVHEEVLAEHRAGLRRGRGGEVGGSAVATL
ncbi:MAG: glycosyltransferase family 1 protein [Phycisphaerales bacterium]|nr:glycosyltransferase family 1 protein [Phycisphaerales bacterium]